MTNTLTANAPDCSATHGDIVTGGRTIQATTQDREDVKLVQQWLGLSPDNQTGTWGRRTSEAMALQMARLHKDENNKKLDIEGLKAQGTDPKVVSALERLQQSVIKTNYSHQAIKVDCPECRAAGQQRPTVDGNRPVPPVPSALDGGANGAPDPAPQEDLGLYGVDPAPSAPATGTQPRPEPKKEAIREAPPSMIVVLDQEAGRPGAPGVNEVKIDGRPSIHMQSTGVEMVYDPKDQARIVNWMDRNPDLAKNYVERQIMPYVFKDGDPAKGIDQEKARYFVEGFARGARSNDPVSREMNELALGMLKEQGIEPQSSMRGPRALHEAVMGSSRAAASASAALPGGIDSKVNMRQAFEGAMTGLRQFLGFDADQYSKPGIRADAQPPAVAPVVVGGRPADMGLPSM